MAGKSSPSRRDLLKMGAIYGSVLLGPFAKVDWAGPIAAAQDDSSAGGKQLGSIPFVDEALSTKMDTVIGSELDGRLYTDLSKLTPDRLVIPTERFYIRTRASLLLPDVETWRVRVDGLVDRPLNLTIETLDRSTRPVGLRLLECAGNARAARFGMIGVANWAGVPVSEILEQARPKGPATRVLITGYDQYATPSVSSIPGASWVFSFAELQSAGAILATKMNDKPLSLDHGAPVRLLVPGWYGCACIKWVNQVTVVDDGSGVTSQMEEYAARTLQDNLPRLAKDYRPALIEPAAMPIRIEKWLVAGKLQYRIVGILWGGSQPVRVLQIRFNPDEDFVPVDGLHRTTNAPWTTWTHSWRPQAPGLYAIRLAVTEPRVQARKLDAGYYVRSVKITEI
jgi:DMSO/TMAO reductase YedYZ molybdopterin-dependent catalytic subunit